MKYINGLADSLNGHFSWNKARMNCFVRIILGLLTVRTVNLQRIALAFASEAQVTSRYRRLQRFFASFSIHLPQVAIWIFNLFFANGDKFYLVIDRTNWYFGKKKINVFMLAIAYEELAIPLFWTLLNKAGNSNYKEQKELIYQFISTFGVERVAGLLADREFASGRLMSWLTHKKSPFIFGLKIMPWRILIIVNLKVSKNYFST